ncbi:MAG: M50 family metallopeptidase [Candidatus Zixiibacteriota bacterium]
MILEILAFIFVLGLLIFVHELGHFAVAKWCGIRVETFSLGFPPKMIGFRKGDTEYCISWIPLGGYVKMSGEKPDEGDIHGRPYEFMSKPIWQRALVIFAGPAMNYVLAVLLLFGIYMVKGQPVDVQTSEIGIVSPGDPADRAGLRPGDVILAIDDSLINSFEGMYGIVTQKPGTEIKLTWLRGADTMYAYTTTRVDTIMNMQGEVQAIGKIGVGRQIDYEPMGFFASLEGGFDMANFYAAQIFVFIRDITVGAVSSKLIGGPLFIAQVAGEAAKQGILPVLFLASILSVNLCVVNLVPIPVLDGGQLLFLLIEKIKGSPISMKGRAIAQQIGLVFLILLIIFVTKNDIWRINIFGW